MPLNEIGLNAHQREHEVSTDTLATGTTSEKTGCSREYLADAQRARRDGRYPTIDDPSR